MSDLSTSQKLGFVAKKVLTSPLSLGIWIGGVVLFMSVQSMIPLAGAVVAQVALVAVRLRDEDYLRRIFDERQEQAASLSDQDIETLLEPMDFETRQRIRYILQLHKEIIREAKGDDVKSFAKEELNRIASQLAPLIHRAIELGTKKQQLSKYLRNVDDRALKTYTMNLKQKIDATTDPIQKVQYEQALKSREAELQTYQAINQACGRIDSQLENIEATFASWKARVLRIKTADLAGASSASDGLSSELDMLNSNIDLLDRSVAEALAAEQELTVSA